MCDLCFPDNNGSEEMERSQSYYKNIMSTIPCHYCESENHVGFECREHKEAELLLRKIFGEK